MELKADAGSVPGVCVGGRVLSGRGAEPLTYVMLITIRLEDSSFVAVSSKETVRTVTAVTDCGWPQSVTLVTVHA